MKTQCPHDLSLNTLAPTGLDPTKVKNQSFGEYVETCAICHRVRQMPWKDTDNPIVLREGGVFCQVLMRNYWEKHREEILCDYQRLPALKVSEKWHTGKTNLYQLLKQWGEKPKRQYRTHKRRVHKTKEVKAETKEGVVKRTSATADVKAGTPAEPLPAAVTPDIIILRATHPVYRF